MKFDIKRVYTSANADELKVGSKVIFGDSLLDLKENVTDEIVDTLVDIRTSDYRDRFVKKSNIVAYNLCYFVAKSENKLLKWTDLKIGDIIREKCEKYEYMVTGIDNREDENIELHIFAGNCWLNDKELANWEKVE